MFHACGTGGSVVEFSPATREARVRFPASATFFHFTHFYNILCDLKHFIISMFHACGTGGSVVEFLLSTQEDWVRFPASATFFSFFTVFCVI